MLDNTIDAAAPALRPEPRAARTDWRFGGRTVLRWREGLLGWAWVWLGAGILAGIAVSLIWPGDAGAIVATAVMWAGMLAAIMVAFRRSRPAGLLRLRWVDLLCGLVLGVALRVAQGWLAAASGTASLPSYPTIAGSLPTGWVFTDVVSVVAIAPLVEEFFFRAVVLITVYSALRRAFGKKIAGVAAFAVSTAAFVLLHSVTPAATVDQVAATVLLGITASMLVLLTGRLWAAVLTHVVFNATFVVLAMVGTFWG